MRKLVTVLVVTLSLPLVACGNSENVGSAVGVTDDGRPVYVFPSDEAIKSASILTDNVEGRGSSVKPAFSREKMIEQRKIWNPLADYACTRISDGDSTFTIGEDYFGPAMTSDQKSGRVTTAIKNACPEFLDGY